VKPSIQHTFFAQITRPSNVTYSVLFGMVIVAASNDGVPCNVYDNIGYVN